MFFALGKWKKFQRAFIAIFVVVLTALSFQTFSYIPKFSSDVASLKHAYYTFSGWKSAAFNYVDVLVEAKKIKEAWRITEIEKTFSHPLWVRDYFRGWILLEKGQVDNAINHLHRASYYTHLRGYFPFADTKLGKAYILKKDYNNARIFLNNVVNAKIYNPLGYYSAKKMLEEIKRR